MSGLSFVQANPCFSFPKPQRLILLETFENYVGKVVIVRESNSMNHECEKEGVGTDLDMDLATAEETDKKDSKDLNRDAERIKTDLSE